GDMLQDREIDGLGCRTKQRVVAFRLEARDQRTDVGEIELGVAPIEEVERAEAMLLDRRDLFFAEAARFFGEAERAETAVLLVPARAAGNLGHLRNRDAPVAATRGLSAGVHRRTR